jgi:hypothetical protein
LFSSCSRCSSVVQSSRRFSSCPHCSLLKTGRLERSHGKVLGDPGALPSSWI